MVPAIAPLLASESVGILLDGFPREVNLARWIINPGLFSHQNSHQRQFCRVFGLPTLVLELEAGRETVVQRVLNRSMSCLEKKKFQKISETL